MDVITDDGCRLHVAVTGEPTRPALVLLNSLGTDMTLWNNQIEPFSEQFRVWRIDTRGHGRSEATKGDYTIERLGRDVLAVMDHAQLARAQVCGISIGGVTALWLATCAPDRVERIVLANTAARIGTVALWEERMAAVRTGGVNALVDGAMGRWFTAGFRARMPETVERIRRTFLDVHPEGYIGCCAALRDADLRTLARRVEAPTLVITGTHDAATPPSDGRWLSEQIRGAAYVEFDAAHLSNVECAAEFTLAVLQFLGAPDHG